MCCTKVNRIKNTSGPIRLQTTNLLITYKPSGLKCAANAVFKEAKQLEIVTNVEEIGTANENLS